MRTALVIVDMINAFVEPETDKGKCKLYMSNAKALIPNINRVIDGLEENDIIIHVNDRHEKNDKEFEVWGEHAVKGTQEAEVAEGFKYGVHEVRIVPKTRFSGFFETNLLPLLCRWGIERLIIVGVATDICILYTTVGAVMRGYLVVVKKDCVAGIFEQHLPFVFEHMQKVLGAEVI